jgi:DNA-binding MarR family transcriptional regulator
MQRSLDLQNVADMRLAKNQEEIDKLREEINTALKERDEATKLVADLEDKLADEVDDNAKLTARHRQLLDQLSQYKIAFADLKAQLDRTPPRLDGLVRAASDEGYVEVSVGFQDGLEKGHLMEVFRKGATPESNKYLGRIRIVRVESDTAVGQVIPEYRQGKIEKNDHVATRLD